MRSQHIRRFVELLLRMPFDEYVQPKRDEGKSYDEISYELTLWLRQQCEELGLPADIKIAGETVRRWHLLVPR
jgi:hypothetical protein